MKREDFILPVHAEERKRTKKNTESTFSNFQISDDIVNLGYGKKYFIHTYGCQANVRDGEALAGMMEMMGYTSTNVPDDADVLFFNTCAIRKAAEDRVLSDVNKLRYLKDQRPTTVFCICGCMAQKEETVKQILSVSPHVDLIFGTHNIHRMPNLLAEVIESNERKVEVFSQEGDVVEDVPVKRSMDSKGFVNIMYGCDKFCTYCIVPYTRGRERSRRMEDILREVEELKASGRKEVVLLGQNVNAYGKDLKMEDGFTQLLVAVAKTGIERISFYTSHPRDYSETTIDAMRDYPNIMPFLHLPVQSGSDEVLRRMARGYTVERYKQLYDNLKKKVPHIAFTTDLIVGFPNETDEEFEATLDLVRYCRFDMAYAFIYSPRAGTPAANMEDNIPLEVKKERLARLNDLLTEIAEENNRRFLGETVSVLCIGTSKRNSEVYSGYSADNKLVNFTSEKDCVNQIVNVEITATHSYYLEGKVL